MIKATTIDLVAENPEAHGVFESYEPSVTTVFAEVRSVTGTEFYRAKEAGIEPSFIFRLTDYADYHGEKIAVWESRRYRIVRSYMSGQSIELTVEEATNDRS